MTPAGSTLSTRRSRTRKTPPEAGTRPWLAAPVPLTENHDFSAFCCQLPGLDFWLKNRALRHQQTRALSTFVACQGPRVLAYYALASNVIVADVKPTKSGSNVPAPIPVVAMARLAVDHTLTGHGIGRALFRDAGLRVLQAADLIGIKGMIAHAVTDEAQGFYDRLGIGPSPFNPQLRVVSLKELRACLQACR